MDSEEIIEAQQQRIEKLEAAIERALEDINWMLNSGQMLNRFVFRYLDEALGE